MKTFFYLIILFHIPTLALGQSTSSYSINVTPYIRNIPKSEYKGANQSWCISQADNGYIYVANRIGLIEYDGNEWAVNSIQTPQELLAVLTDKDIIYYSQFEDFGYFGRDTYGNLIKNSLSDSLVSPSELTNENIWFIDKIGEQIYFRSFGKIFIYDGEKIEVISPGITVYSLFEYNGIPYVDLLDDGLHYIDDENKLQRVPVPDFMKNKRIIKILGFENGKELVFTEFDGIYLKNGNSYTSWDCEANNLLKTYQINKIEAIHNNKIVIGTIGNGIVIFNQEGKILNLIDKESGLQNNTVLSLMIDINNNIWAGLNAGIDYIKINSPYSFCFDKTGQLGAVICAKEYNGNLYIGTNQGLFYTKWNNSETKNKFELTKIEEAHGQVWELKIIDNKLFCNYNLGLLQIDENNVKRIGTVGGFTVIQHPIRDDIIYQGNYIGIQIFKRNNGEWKEFKWLHQSIGGARTLHLDHFNYLWASGNFKNVNVFGLNNSADSILTTRLLDENSGFSPYSKVQTFSFENRISFINNKKIFTYDYAAEKVKWFEWLNAEIKDYNTSDFVVKVNHGEYWFLNQNKYGKFNYNGGKLILDDEINLGSSQISVESDKQNIEKLNETTYILGIDDGFMLYDSENKPDTLINNKFNLSLSKVSSFNRKGILLPLENKANKQLEIPYKFRNLTMSYTVPGLLPENYSVQYRMDDEEWVGTGKSKTISLNYLPWGSYELNVRALDNNEELLSYSTKLIRILAPWYLKVYMLLIYAILASVIIYLAIIFYRVRLKKQKLAYLKKIKSDNTRRIIKMKNQHLRNEVQTKSTQLVNYTVLLKNKNEVLIKLKDLFDRILPGNSQDEKIKKQIYNIIDQNLSDKGEWKMFSSHFDEAHNNFLKKLKHSHEVLTPADLQLCAFLKMNLSSKEIALLLNISHRSIEVKRYRLRQKLQLEHENNLVEYLLNI